MLKAVTWCAKCLFLYFLVVVVAVRFSWIFTTPVLALATRMHWTQLTRVAFVLSYFLPIFAAAGFLVGLIPFGKIGKALRDLFRSFFPSASTKLAPEPDPVPPILWPWLPAPLLGRPPACSARDGLPTASSLPAPCSFSSPAPSPFYFATASPLHANHG